MAVLASARYGKDNVRVYKVHRDQATGVQTVTEMTVCCLLEGQIETSYTKADNSVVVATDSIKKAHAAMYMGWDVNGFPMKLFGSMSSAKAKISAMDLALDMDSSRLLGSSCVRLRLPKGESRAGRCKMMIKA